MDRALAEREITHEPLADTGLDYVRRAQPAGHDYFIANLSARRFDGWVRLGVPARHAVLLDPMTGGAGFAALKIDDANEAHVYLQRASGESMLLRTSTRETEAPATPWRYLQPLEQPVTLTGEWDIRFIAGGPEIPPPRVTSTLRSWTEFDGDTTRRFAGTARYRIEFALPEQPADEWLLDLGDVREAARVRLNGEEIGAACCLPFHVRLGRLTQRRNVLEIDVTNLAANRIRDMDRRKKPWRVMKDIDIVNVHYRPFDAAQWALAPSGLLGPVRLIPMKRTQP
jgi:hypothetical protein